MDAFSPQLPTNHRQPHTRRKIGKWKCARKLKWYAANAELQRKKMRAYAQRNREKYKERAAKRREQQRNLQPPKPPKPVKPPKPPSPETLRKMARERYLVALDKFAGWCAARGLVFKSEMEAAMKNRMESCQ